MKNCRIVIIMVKLGINPHHIALFQGVMHTCPRGRSCIYSKSRSTMRIDTIREFPFTCGPNLGVGLVFVVKL